MKFFKNILSSDELGRLGKQVEALEGYSNEYEQDIDQVHVLPNLHTIFPYNPTGFLMSFKPDAIFTQDFFFTHMHSGIIIRRIPRVDMNDAQRAKLLEHMNQWFPYRCADGPRVSKADSEVPEFQETLGENKSFVGVFTAEVPDDNNVMETRYYIIANVVPDILMGHEIDKMYIEFARQKLTYAQVANHTRTKRVRRMLYQNRMRIVANMMVLLGVEDGITRNPMYDYGKRNIPTGYQVSRSKLKPAVEYYLANSTTKYVHINYEIPINHTEVSGYRLGYDLYVLHHKLTKEPGGMEIFNQVTQGLKLHQNPCSINKAIDIEYNYICQEGNNVKYYSGCTSSVGSRGVFVIFNSPLCGISVVVDRNAGEDLVTQGMKNKCGDSIPIEYPQSIGQTYSQKYVHDRAHNRFTCDGGDIHKSRFLQMKHYRWSDDISQMLGLNGLGSNCKEIRMNPLAVRVSLSL